MDLTGFPCHFTSFGVILSAAKDLIASATGNIGILRCVQDDTNERKSVPVTYYVYIMTNKSNRVLYIGVTNNLERRDWAHKNKQIEGFISRYNLTKLVYFEQTSDINSALEREKQLKGWLRVKKNKLIESVNPDWKDLSDSWYSAHNDIPNPVSS